MPERTYQPVFVCPHCEDAGFVCLPKRYHRRETRLGHAAGCLCVACLHSGAHRWYFQALPAGAEEAKWLSGTALCACRFCAQGDRFREWSRDVNEGRDAAPVFRPIPRGDRTFPVTPDERERIAAGVAWDRLNPVERPQVRKPDRNEQPERSIGTMPALTDAMDDWSLAERKKQLRRQAESLGATTDTTQKGA